jgi:hypothetical protein
MQSVSDQPLDNFSEGSFFNTEIGFGSQRQVVNLLVDTGSSWTWTSVDDCDPTIEKCTQKAFHAQASDSFVLTDTFKSIVYGSHKSDGYVARDDLFLSNNMSAIGMEFLAVREIDRVLEGILGLSPIDESAGPLLVN